MDQPPHQPGYRHLRYGRVSLAGQVYLVTTVTHRRRPAFADFDAARAACQALVTSPAWLDSNLLAWVLMPDHWHGLVELGMACRIADIVHAIKGRIAVRTNAALQRRGKLWQSGYHEHALRSDESVQHAARYLVANPVRAGLVKRVGDYPFWDAIWLDPDRTTCAIASSVRAVPPSREKRRG